MNSKKAITLLVLVTLIMGLVPLVPVQAIAITTGTATVYYDDEFTLEGDGVPGGRTVNVYWDDMEKETFSDGSGKVASGKAKRDQTYEIDFDIPEGVVGSHYIYVKDVVTEDWDVLEVTMDSSIEVNPSSGLKGDKVTVNGYGFGYDDDEDEGYDVDLLMEDVLYGSAITVTFNPETPETDELGSWAATFSVPDEPYGDYTITGTDDDPVPNGAVGDFTIGASITLSIEEGPVGSVVTISGRGFDDGEEVTVTIDGVPSTSPCHIISGDTVRSDGRITTRIVIPSVDLDGDEPTDYTITVEDEAGGDMVDINSADADFEVNGVAEVTATPSYGTQGGKITVEGWNFTRSSGTEVEVTLGVVGDTTFKTDSSGHFKGDFTIPAIASDDADLIAVIDYDVGDITAEDSVRVGIMLVIITPDDGPSGAKVSITGVGFEDGAAYTATIGDEDWFTGTAEPDGTIAASPNIPTIDPGTYTITLTEDESEIDVTAIFTVTDKTMVELDPVMAPNEYSVDIEGWFFAEDPEVDNSLEFLLYNETSEWILEVTYENDDADPPIPETAVELELDEDWDDGYFMGTFEVPDADALSMGTYYLNVTDGKGMFAQATFEVVSKITSINPRKATFRIGETVAFNVQSSFAQEDAYVKIMDPDGELYWTTDSFDADNWVKVGTVQVYPFYEQVAGGNPMVLLEDAPIGTYTWTYYDSDDDELDSGVFNVAAAPADILSEQVQDLNEAMADLSSEISTVSDAVAGVKSDVNSAIAAANAAVEAANSAVEAVNSVAGTASQAAQAAQNAADAAESAQNAASGLTTLVYGAIGASLVAALAAIVSLMQISRRIAG